MRATIAFALRARLLGMSKKRTTHDAPAQTPRSAAELAPSNGAAPGGGCLFIVGTPIGFSLGATLTTVKKFEAHEVLRLGAGELDMVMNVAALKSGERDFVQNDIRAIVEVAHEAEVILKVILETPLLTHEEKIVACELSVAAGADFVKTATGLFGGATVEDIALMRSVVGDRARVKASGGVRTAKDLAAMVQAGADRIGTSSGVNMMRDLGAPELA